MGHVDGHSNVAERTDGRTENLAGPSVRLSTSSRSLAHANNRSAIRDHTEKCIGRPTHRPTQVVILAAAFTEAVIPF